METKTNAQILLELYGRKEYEHIHDIAFEFSQDFLRSSLDKLNPPKVGYVGWGAHPIKTFVYNVTENTSVILYERFNHILFGYHKHIFNTLEECCDSIVDEYREKILKWEDEIYLRRESIDTFNNQILKVLEIKETGKID